MEVSKLVLSGNLYGDLTERPRDLFGDHSRDLFGDPQTELAYSFLRDLTKAVEFAGDLSNIWPECTYSQAGKANGLLHGVYAVYTPESTESSLRVKPHNFMRNREKPSQECHGILQECHRFQHSKSTTFSKPHSQRFEN